MFSTWGYLMVSDMKRAGSETQNCDELCSECFHDNDCFVAICCNLLLSYPITTPDNNAWNMAQRCTCLPNNQRSFIIFKWLSSSASTDICTWDSHCSSCIASVRSVFSSKLRKRYEVLQNQYYRNYHSWPCPAYWWQEIHAQLVYHVHPARERKNTSDAKTSGEDRRSLQPCEGKAAAMRKLARQTNSRQCVSTAQQNESITTFNQIRKWIRRIRVLLAWLPKGVLSRRESDYRYVRGGDSAANACTWLPIPVA